MFKSTFENLCHKKGVTPTEACRAIGISPSNYTRYTDDSLPRHSTLLRMADYFGVSVSELTEGASDEAKPATSFWDVFARLCNEKRVSPATVGKAIGITSASISGWKQGAVPRETTLLRLADYFGVEPADLIPVEAEKENAPDAPQSIGDAAAPQSDEAVMRDYLMSLFDRADQSGKDYLISVAESVVLRRPGSLGRKK